MVTGIDFIVGHRKKEKTSIIAKPMNEPSLAKRLVSEL